MRASLSLMVSGALVLAACGDDPSQPASALSLPIDFAYACEATGGMQAGQNDETAAALDDTRLCPDVNGAQGELWGVALNRQPAGLIVMQMNPAAGSRGFIDADFFRPGTSAIPVGEQPIGVYAAADHSAFFVVSAGDERIDRVVINSHDTSGLKWTTTSIPLPGVPAAAVVVGDFLLVSARDAATIWRIATDFAGTPEVTALAAPGRVLSFADVGSDSQVVATFRDRKSVALLSRDGAMLAEAGLVPQCRDGLDNDGQSGSDKDDPNCLDMDDDDESAVTGESRDDLIVPAAVADDGSCDDGLDNDGDGLTDRTDETCLGTTGSELVPACSDGVDNDGDGLTDLDDDSCYSEFGNFEGQVPDDGPFHPTFIDAAAAGQFVYVLDERSGQIVVFTFTGSGFVRVDVNLQGPAIPNLESVPFNSFGSDVRSDVAVPSTKQPALERRGIKNIEILDGNAFSLSSSRLRGEIWDRIIASAKPSEQPTVSLAPNDAEWKPARCAPTNTAACEQPAHDDDTWFAFGANLDGRMQLIEAVRRGVPVHRLAQRELDLNDRGGDVSAPRLTLRGRLINARGEPQRGFPFVGAALEELLVDEVDDVAPAKLRRFGIWPADDFEQMPSETWTLTFEGKIPGTSGDLGALVADGGDTLLVDPTNTFCDDGVAVGDWVQLEVPFAVAAAKGLTTKVAVTLTDGFVCDALRPKTQLIELPVTGVREGEVVVDLAHARLRPSLPVLDEDTIRAGEHSLRACAAALDDLDDVLGLPENLKAIAVAAADLPARFPYSVRGQGWVLVGTRSGFLHRQRWDRTGGTCGEDPTIATNFTADIAAKLRARPDERSGAVAQYASCPPPSEQLSKDQVEPLAPEASRFTNPSFGLDVFPACVANADGTIGTRASQQDTTFTFDVTGPYVGSALSIANSILMDRVPQLDIRRQQIQLDASAKRASILQFRFGDPKVIATFE